MTSSHQAFILGYRSADVDLRPLHPSPSQIPFMWQIFQENVDPIVKVLHVPTMNRLIREVRNNPDSLTPSTEALMFSIYYAAMTSMNDDEVRPLLLSIPPPSSPSGQPADGCMGRSRSTSGQTKTFWCLSIASHSSKRWPRPTSSPRPILPSARHSSCSLCWSGATTIRDSPGH